MDQVNNGITHLLLPEDKVSDLAIPAWQRGRELRVELPCTGAICGALAHLQVDKQLARRLAAVAEHFLAINLEQY